MPLSFFLLAHTHTLTVLSAAADMICISRSLLTSATTGALCPDSAPSALQLKGFHSITRRSALPEAITFSMLFQVQQWTDLVWPGVGCACRVVCVVCW